MQAPITDILHNGELENLENYKIFRRRYPKRQTFPIRTITDWYIQEIPMINKPNRLWICLVGIHKNTMIRTSPIISIINSKKVCSSNCIYILGPKAQKKENEMRGLGFAFESGFPDNWEELVEAALSFKEDQTEKKNGSFRNDSARIIDEEAFLKVTSDNLMKDDSLTKIDAKEDNFLDLDQKDKKDDICTIECKNDDICTIEEKKDISISETKSKEEDNQGPRILFKTEVSTSSPVKRGSLNINTNLETQSLKEESRVFDAVSLANANVESHSLPTSQEVNIENAPTLNDDLNILLDKVDSNKYSFKDDDFSDYDDSLLKEEQVTYAIRNPSNKAYPTVEEVIKNSPFKSPSERRKERLARAGNVSNNDLDSLNRTRTNTGDAGELSDNGEKSFSKVHETFAELGITPQFNESVISSSKISDLSVTKMKDTPRKKSSQTKENTVESSDKKSSLDAVYSRDKHSSVVDSEAKTTELYQTCLEDKIEFLNSFCFDEKVSELPVASQDIGAKAISDEAQLNGKSMPATMENIDNTLLCNNQPISDVQLDDLNENETIRKPNDKDDSLINANVDVLDLAKENKAQLVEFVKPDCGKVHVKNKDSYISNVGSKTEDEILFQTAAKRRTETLKRHSFDDLNRKRCKEDLAEAGGKPKESLNILNDHSGVSLGIDNGRKPSMTATNNMSVTSNAVGSDVSKNIVNVSNAGDYGIINSEDKNENSLVQNEVDKEDSDIQILNMKKANKTASSSATPTKKRMGLQSYHKISKDNKSAVKRPSIRISLPSSRIRELSNDSQDLNSKSYIEDSLKTNNLVNQGLTENRSKIEENILPVNETKEDGIDLNLPKSALTCDDSLKEAVNAEDDSETKDSLTEDLENEFPVKIVSSMQNEENVSMTNSKARKPAKKRSRLIMPKKFKLSSKKKY